MVHDRVLLIKELDDFQKLVSWAPGLLVVDFFAKWCYPCQAIAPKYLEFSKVKEYSGVIFAKVDVDESMEISQKFGVSAMPTFLFFKYGQLIDKLEGSDINNLISYINKYK